MQRLKGLVEQQVEKFDPANPHNKAPDGKLTEEGVECCYRMFDEGKSRYSVAQQMKISFAAATPPVQQLAQAGWDQEAADAAGVRIAKLAGQRPPRPAGHFPRKGEMDVASAFAGRQRLQCWCNRHELPICPLAGRQRGACRPHVSDTWHLVTSPTL